MPSVPWQRDATIAAVALLLLLAWDAIALDMAVERLFGGPGGFALRDVRWATVAYDIARGAAWTVVLLLVASLWVRLPVFRRVDRARRVWWLLTTIVCLAAIPLLRSHSATSCPWSLTEFGGTVPYVSHWWRQADAGPGKCFPSGHATTGFAFLAGFFALRGVDRRLALQWLGAAMAIGAFAAATQTMRGAHFVSHSLWTAWICWTLTAASWHAMRLASSRIGVRTVSAPSALGGSTAIR